jgi:uncharacterized damage-inducible protein DinB/heme-degrading monooxygenase HmoA
MITRIWHGRVKKRDAEKYRRYVIDTGIRDYLKIKGNAGAQILQSSDDEVSHIFTVTQWDNMESVKKFAGKNYAKAKYYPDDEKYLLELEPEVQHYETVSFSNLMIRKLLQQFTDLYDGNNWTDRNFISLLSSVDEETAFEQPFPGKHSVAEILWHIIYWRRAVLHRVKKDFKFEERTEKEQNFLSPEQLRKKGWKKLGQELTETQEQLVKSLITKTDDFLEEENRPGHKNRTDLEGLLHHDYYHLGQIGFVISILRGQHKAAG